MSRQHPGRIGIGATLQPWSVVMKTFARRIRPAIAAAATAGLTAVAGLVAAASPAVAQAVVEATDGGVTLEADEASVDDVLAELAKVGGFAVERVGEDTCSKPVSGHFAGPLTSVLAHALEAENHVVVSSGGTVAKVVVMSACKPAVQAVAATPTAVAQPVTAAQVLAQPAARLAQGTPLAGPKPLAREVLGPAHTTVAAIKGR